MGAYPIRKVSDAPISVVTTSTLALADNPNRKYALLINTSNTDIWLRLGQAAVLGSGIFIARGGFAYEITGENLWTGAIYAIHGGAGAKVMSVLEMS